MEKKRIAVIGGGIGGLGTALLLARDGHTVALFEKTADLGGVCGRFEIPCHSRERVSSGLGPIAQDLLSSYSSQKVYRSCKDLDPGGEKFVFDTGPSWYMMPEVYCRFFELTGERIEDHLDVVKLSPAYRVIAEGQNRPLDFICDLKKDLELYESLESGASKKVQRLFGVWKARWEAGDRLFLRKNYDSIAEFMTIGNFKALLDLGVFSSAGREIASQFRAPLLRALFSFFPAFLGGTPKDTPALFNFLNASALDGIYYPKGGMYQIVEALVRIGKKYGVLYRTGADVRSIVVSADAAQGVRLADGELYECDLVVSAVDRTFTEEKLLDVSFPRRRESRWNFLGLDSRLRGNDRGSLRPSYSALLIYLGVEGTVPELLHHTIYFSKNPDRHFADIESGSLPQNPSVYISATSKSDSSVAPSGHENLFVLVPIPPRVYEKEELEKYGDFVLSYLEQKLPIPDFQKRIVYKKIFGGQQFSEAYNTYGNSALGPAHTLFQSGPWRSNNVHPRIKNLYFAGSSTNPGIGIPPVLLSAERVWKRINTDFKG